jgi:hypothetical protein
MMGKSLSYAYAEGGAVKPQLPAISHQEMNAMPDGPEKRAAAGALVTYREQQAAWAAENLTKPTEPVISLEQMQAMPMGNEKVAAANAISAYAAAMKDYRKEANPDIDYSEAGHAAALADAQRVIAENAERQGAAGNPEGITSVTEGDVTFSGNPDHFMVGEFNQQPVDTTGGFNVGDVTLPNATVTPEYQAQPDFTYTPPPTTFTELTGIGENAGQSDYQEFIEQNPQQTATQYSTYTPPEFQGVGSYLTPQQGSYLMYSTPGSVFKRPEGG